MKLFHKVMLHISITSIVVMAAWSVFFYWTIIDEVNDELDDSLEDYSEMLIIRELNGEDMPSANNGSNNQYYIYSVTDSYAESHNKIQFRDEMVYIDDKLETEPARVLVTIFKTDEGYKELVVYSPTIDKIDLQKAILGWIIILYVGIVVTLLLLNVWVFRRNMKPLYTLLSWFRNYKIGEGVKPLSGSPEITEFKELYDAITVSVDRNEKLYDQQKLFIGNASHEMQTPLASCKNRLEMLLEDDGMSEKNMIEIAKTLETLERLSRMNKSLLMLSKIENGQYSELKEVNFCELITQYIEMYGEIFAYKNIQVETFLDIEFKLQINDSLAAMLVSNLIKNAFLHNINDGKIVVTVKNNEFTVSSSGDKPLDSSKIFQRFYQGSKKEGSTGLGLALCDTICKVSHLEISYEFIDGMHNFNVGKEKVL